MSKRYKGGVISATPPTTSTSSASGVWTEQQFMQGVASGSWPALAGAPTIGTATAGALSASVAFTAPAYVGSGITGYTATSNPGGITGTGASSPVTVSGLTAGTAYTFTVTATTAAGQGSASAASNSVTPTLPTYIEDVFSTYLYTGDQTARSITNNIDLSTKGGLVWIKDRSNAIRHAVFDSARGSVSYLLIPNSTAAQNVDFTNNVTSFNADGFSLGTGSNENGTGRNYASWTFAEQPKFFDVVTYTGNTSGGSSQTIAHNLGSVPGCIIVKATSIDGEYWAVWHRSFTTNQVIYLNVTDAVATTGAGNSFPTLPTSTNFTVGFNGSQNGNGTNYVAYLFAHDAGGFGLTGTDNVISCGSYYNSGSSPVNVNLGYEPQWILIKKSDSAQNWFLVDTMRGSSLTAQNLLKPNTSDAEVVNAGAPGYPAPTATGFTTYLGAAGDFIYIAIRRGPMKVPTDATKVFSPIAATNSAGSNNTTNFTVDLQINSLRSAGDHLAVDRLRGVSSTATNIGSQLITNSTAAEAGSGAGSITRNWSNTGFQTSDEYGSLSTIYWNFGRAPSFFDEVCYTGTGVARTVTHNLAAVPELMIVKSRTPAGNEWIVYVASLGNQAYLQLNRNYAVTTSNPIWNNTTPTSSVFSVGVAGDVNGSGNTQVAYLFATLAGVSKVGTYNGSDTLQTINCGFTGGARFVLIKRTNTTGNWFVWDTARGMVSGTDPSLMLNNTSAETNANSVYTIATGFQILGAPSEAINNTGDTYIFLAIA